MPVDFRSINDIIEEVYGDVIRDLLTRNDTSLFSYNSTGVEKVDFANSLEKEEYQLKTMGYRNG